MPPQGLGPPAMGPPPAPLGSTYSPAIFNLNQTKNMSGNSLTEALLLLSGVYLSVVQPAPGPTRIGLHAVFPTTSAGDFMKEVTRTFQGHKKMRTLMKYKNIGPSFDITSSYSRSRYAPKELLDILCEEVFPQNTITVFYVNNAEAMQKYDDPTVKYLPQIISSLGLPIISYDTQFSFNKRPPLSIQLAPTMGQMMDVLFTFLKMYNWTDFSFFCTLSKGCLDEIAAIRTKVEESHRRPRTTIYGVEMFPFNLLSYVNFTDGRDREEVEEKLKNEMDKDTRVILVHGEGSEVKSILEAAKDLGLTGKEYVWIFTKASITIFKDDSPVSKSYPLGSFVIGYNSARKDMVGIIQKAIDIWLQALDHLAASPEMKEIDFETDFTCEETDYPRNQSRNSLVMRWKYGEVLYRYMLQAKLEGGIEFDEYGILKGNRFWIRNIQVADIFSRRSKTTSRYYGGSRSSPDRVSPPRSSPPRRPTGIRDSGAPRTPGSSRGRTPISRGRTPSGRDRPTGISSGRDRSSGISSGRNPSSGISRGGDRSSGISRGGDRSPGISRGRDRSSGIFSDRDRASGAPDNRDRYSGNTRGRERPTGDPASRGRDSRLPGRPASRIPGRDSPSRSSPVSSRRLQNSSAPKNRTSRVMMSDMTEHGARADESRTEVEFYETTAEPLEDGDFFKVNEKSTDDRPKDKARMPSRYDPRNPRRSSRSSRQRDGRRKRALGKVTHIAKRIADWDGQKLTISSITWPGGASKPPKGKPEKYILRVATWREDPHVIYVDPDNTTGECDSHSLQCMVYERDRSFHRSKDAKEMCCTGLCMDLLKRLSEELHIDVDLYETPDGTYGSPLNDNLTRWSGLMGMLTRNEADLAMAALSITPERSEAVEFSMPFLQTGISIIVAIRAGVISPTAFLEPYDFLSWTLILVFSVHATGTSIFIFEWLSPFGLNHGKTPLSVHKFSLCRSFWLIWAMLFGASVSTDMPRGGASRFLANIWALFAVVFCASYTANLAAFMITKDDFYDLSGIQDWRLKNPHHRQPPFKFATISNSSTDTNIKHNYPEIHTFMKNFGQYDVKMAVESLKNQNIQAFIYDSTTLEYEVGKDVGCKLKTVGKRIAETGYGIAFPKKSQWIKKFNVALLRLQEDGEIERIQKFWLAGACHKKKERVGVSSHTLGILNFTSAFILLGGGIILGALLLTLEHIYFRFGRKQLRKWDKYGCCSLVSLSMGQSLTFERSVMEAIDYHKHHKCKDPICETQLWKVKHELDLAVLKIAQLRKQIAFTTSKSEGLEIPPAEAIGGEDSPSEKHRNGTTAPRRRRQSPTDGNKHDASTKPFLLADDDEDDDEDGDNNNYNSLKLDPHKMSNGNRTKPLYNDTDGYTNPKMKPAVVPRQPRKSSHPPSNKTPVETTFGHERYDPSHSAEQPNLNSYPTPSNNIPSFLPPPPPPEDAMTDPSLRQATSSPPLPPPPSPPPIDIEDHSAASSSPSRPTSFPNQYERVITPAPSSDATMYEPVVLDSTSYPTTPSSPSSSSSQTSNNVPQSPGGMSNLSNEGMSLPSSPDRLSYSSDTGGVSNNRTLPQRTDRHEPTTQGRDVTNPFSPQQSVYSTDSSVLDNNKPSQPNESKRKNGDVTMTSLKEADNDVDSRRGRSEDGNVYVNMDDVIGKETTF